MTESTEVQALEKISTEVGESQIKITLSSHCIKAQAFLVDKLRKQTERQKEICSYISNSNLKLSTEIKQAELEIKSLIIAHDTIKNSNIELRKELLLAKEEKAEILDRIKNGEKKYEELWLESKNRYESIPHVQLLLQATAKTSVINENLKALAKQSNNLKQEYRLKKSCIAKADRTRIIELAQYLAIVYPNTLKAMQDKYAALDALTKEIDDLVKVKEDFVHVPFKQISVIQKQSVNDQTNVTKLADNGWLNICTNTERDMIMMPRLQFSNTDFDALNSKLDQIKVKKVEILNTTPARSVELLENMPNKIKSIQEDDFSLFFNHSDNKTENEKKDDYSKKKLINILEDVQLDSNNTYKIISKVNKENLKGVSMIGDDKVNDGKSVVSEEKDTENIEEIDLTQSRTQTNLLIPPTQFLDLSQEKMFNKSPQQMEVIVHMSMPSDQHNPQSKNSQESVIKKRVTFELPCSMQDMSNKLEDVPFNENVHSQINETIDSQADLSLVSDESYSKIKDMILKKHNLDLSPNFVYAKNEMLHMNKDENIVTSKFFQKDNPNFEEENNARDDAENSQKEHCQSNNQTTNINDHPEISMDVDDIVVSSPKHNEMTKSDRPVAGLLFNHGTQGIPDSLNVSISTTGFEEGEADFPHCIDSSLLLSPKADIPIPTSIGDNNNVISQEVPNFLTGLRKTGLSFFGQPSSTESRSDNSGQSQGNNFNFNFGGGDQKNRGGLFSMFR